MELFHEEITQLKEIYGKNGYGNKFFDRCIRIFLNKIYSKKVPQNQNIFPKKYVYISCLI